MCENKAIKCPKCGSGNVTCMDGAGAVLKYGYDVMIDIAPEMWLCNDCKESFRVDWETFFNTDCKEKLK